VALALQRCELSQKEIPGTDYYSTHEYMVAKNHLNRDFSAQTIGQKCVFDLDLQQSLHRGLLILEQEKDGCT
jgi:hypothetical protein